MSRELGKFANGANQEGENVVYFPLPNHAGCPVGCPAKYKTAWIFPDAGIGGAFYARVIR